MSGLPGPLRPAGSGQLRQFGWLAVIAVVGGLAAGWLFSQLNPGGAAGFTLGDRVISEEDPGDPQAPTSGLPRGIVQCGESPTSLRPDDQRATVAAGRIVVQYDPDTATADDLATIKAFTLDRPVAVVSAPNEDLDVVVAVSGWRHRMGLSEADPALLDAFVVKYGGVAPVADAACGDDLGTG